MAWTAQGLSTLNSYHRNTFPYKNSQNNYKKYIRSLYSCRLVLQQWVYRNPHITSCKIGQTRLYRPD